MMTHPPSHWRVHVRAHDLSCLVYSAVHPLPNTCVYDGGGWMLPSSPLLCSEAAGHAEQHVVDEARRRGHDGARENGTLAAHR
jgi:hypothetical protein